MVINSNRNVLVLCLFLILQLLDVELYGQNSCAANVMTQVIVSGKCYKITNTCPRSVMIPDYSGLNTASFEVYMWTIR